MHPAWPWACTARRWRAGDRYTRQTGLMHRGRSSLADGRARRLGTGLLTVLGVLLLLVAAVAVGYPLWWEHRSTTVGERLARTFESPRSARPAETAAACVASGGPSSSGGAAGLVSIPALSLTAPVLDGLSGAVLAVAAGHDPSSPWPGSEGESVVESHDVSYFSRIDRLKPGATVIWVQHCRDLTFKVLGHEILQPGDAISPPAGGKGLALITCYPTNALFYTPDRFVLLTAFVSSTARRTALPHPAVDLPGVRVPAPPALVGEGLELDGSGVLVGYLRMTGSPAPGFLQGPAGLDLERLALESYIGAEKAIEAGNASWWHDLARTGLPMPARVWSNSLDTDVTEDVRGTAVESVTLSSPKVTFVLAAMHGDLLIKTIDVP